MRQINHIRTESFYQQGRQGGESRRYREYRESNDWFICGAVMIREFFDGIGKCMCELKGGRGMKGESMKSESMRGRKHVIGFLVALAIMVMAASSVSAATRISEKMAVGTTMRLQVKSIYGAVRKASWSSSNKKIATVSKKGVVKAKKPGNCVIRARYGGRTFTCRLRVYKNVLRMGPSETKFGTVSGEEISYYAEKMSFNKNGTFSVRLWLFNQSNIYDYTIRAINLVVCDVGSRAFVNVKYTFGTPIVLRPGDAAYRDLTVKHSEVNRVVDLTKIRGTYSLLVS